MPIEFVKEPFTGENSPMANLLLSMLGAVAEFERSLIKEPQKEEIALANARDVYSGRKPTLSPARIAELRECVQLGIPQAKVARDFKISRETVYQYLKSI